MTDLELAQAELARLERMTQHQRQIVARLMAKASPGQMVEVAAPRHRVRAITPGGSTQFASLEQYYPFAGE